MKRNQFLYIFVICALLGTILGYRKSLEAGGYTQVLDSPVIAAIPPNPIINSTLAGGLDSEYVTDMAIGPDGSIYVCGYTYSQSFPTTPGAYDGTFCGTQYWDSFVCRLSPDCTTMIYATYLGGSWRDTAEAIAVDTQGCAYVCGITDSSSTPFPTTPGAFDTSYAGNTWDSFVCKLSADGTKLLNSTFLGGAVADMATDIIIDASNRPVVIGYSASSAFPTTVGAYDQSINGGTIYGDVFVTKFNPTLSGLIFSTWVGGTDEDIGYGVCLDPDGNVLITGLTESGDFPKTTGAYDTSPNGDYDVFLCKLSVTGSSLLNGTLLGGSTYDSGRAVSLSSAGDIFVTGFTDSSNFDTTLGAFDEYRNGGTYDAFVAKFNANMTTLAYSTLIGGSGNEEAYAIDIDSSGCAWVGGKTSSANFNVTAYAYKSVPIGGGDSFLTQFTPSGSALNFSTYFGGPSEDVLVALYVKDPFLITVGGWAWGYNFPTTSGAYNETTNGARDAFCSKVAFIDTDGDGLGDWIEINRYGCDPAKQDTDSDSLDDYEEIAIHGTSPILVDTDGDLMPDGWEVINELDPLINDGAADPDGDGISNLDEYLDNTDPHHNDTPPNSPGIDSYPLSLIVIFVCIAALLKMRKPLRKMRPQTSIRS